MGLFAEYEPQDHGIALEGATLRRARPDDALDLARIAAEREQGAIETFEARFKRELASDASCNVVWVVEVNSRVVGYARAREMAHPSGAVPNHIPAGWYLGGVVIAPEFRRRGLGRALTKERILYLGELGAREVYFVVNANNHPSIDLHAEFGFEEVTRDFFAPGVSFSGGVGILYRKPLL